MNPTDEKALALLEALADERVGVLPGEVTGEDVDALVQDGLVEVADGAVRLRSTANADARRTVADWVRGRPLAWRGRSPTHGDVLDAFDRHCREELDDIDVLETAPTRLLAEWRGRERAAIELRAGHIACERLAGQEPIMLLTDIDTGLVDRFLDDRRLRDGIAVYDLAVLRKIGTARASVFVYFEWFLRERYGVRPRPAPEFTAGLIERGVISTGMG